MEGKSPKEELCRPSSKGGSFLANALNSSDATKRKTKGLFQNLIRTSSRHTWATIEVLEKFRLRFPTAVT